jgi:putative hemolysin
MLDLRHDHLGSRQQHLRVAMAHTETEVIEAKRLRYRVFAEELGARLPTLTPGVDHDIFDPFCEHLIVRDEARGRIVGTYRILSPEGAKRVGSYYSETEFDLTRLHYLRSRIVEVGRCCIDPEYRSGAVIALLWSGVAGYMLHNDYDYLIGCASIGMADGGHNAASIYARLGEHMSPLECRVFPRCALPMLKGYLRVGAWVCGEPAWDPDFNTADLLLLLPMSRISERYSRHFVERLT